MLPKRESDNRDSVEIRLDRNINNPMIGCELYKNPAVGAAKMNDQEIRDWSKSLGQFPLPSEWSSHGKREREREKEKFHLASLWNKTTRACARLSHRAVDPTTRVRRVYSADSTEFLPWLFSRILDGVQKHESRRIIRLLDFRQARKHNFYHSISDAMTCPLCVSVSVDSYFWRTLFF